MVGPKLEDTECNAVIPQASTEFCSRCQRLNFNNISAELFFKNKNKQKTLSVMSVCIASCLAVHNFSKHCICCTQVLKGVCSPCYQVLAMTV